MTEGIEYQGNYLIIYPVLLARGHRSGNHGNLDFTVFAGDQKVVWLNSKIAEHAIFLIKPFCMVHITFVFYGSIGQVFFLFGKTRSHRSKLNRQDALFAVMKQRLILIYLYKRVSINQYSVII